MDFTIFVGITEAILRSLAIVGAAFGAVLTAFIGLLILARPIGWGWEELVEEPILWVPATAIIIFAAFLAVKTVWFAL